MGVGALRIGRWVAAGLLLWTAAPAAGVSQPAVDTAPTQRCPLGAPYNRGNVFARIIRHDAPAAIVDEDERAIAFIPLAWDYPGHVLVVPKAPARNIYDLADTDLLAVLRMVKRVSRAQQQALGATGFTVVQNNVRDQEICQAHFHVIPDTPRQPTPASTLAERQAMAARLHAALPAP